MNVKDEPPLLILQEITEADPEVNHRTEKITSAITNNTAQPTNNNQDKNPLTNERSVERSADNRDRQIEKLQQQIYIER